MTDNTERLARLIHEAEEKFYYACLPPSMFGIGPRKIARTEWEDLTPERQTLLRATARYLIEEKGVRLCETD